MNKTPTVSIIVPIYNANSSLERCLDSLLNQSYRHTEIILVNDGSTDQSLETCKAYSLRDSRFIVINQRNQGVSSARNAGIDRAKGRYITFVDPDDTLEPNAVECMTNEVHENKLDAVRFRYRKIQGVKSIKPDESIDSRTYNGDEDMLNLGLGASLGRFGCYVWLLIINRNIIEESGLRFEPGISMMEDAWFYLDLLQHVKFIAQSDTVTYNYIDNDDGATKSNINTVDKLESIIKVNNRASRQGFSAEQLKYVNAIHAKHIANMVMTRVDNLSIRQSVQLMHQAGRLEGYRKIVAKSDFRQTNLYNRLAVWTIQNQNKTMLLTLRLIRTIRRVLLT